jgi:hypothetical protein
MYGFALLPLCDTYLFAMLCCAVQEVHRTLSTLLPRLPGPAAAALAPHLEALHDTAVDTGKAHTTHTRALIDRRVAIPLDLSNCDHVIVSAPNINPRGMGPSLALCFCKASCCWCQLVLLQELPQLARVLFDFSISSICLVLLPIKSQMCQLLLPLVTC